MHSLIVSYPIENDCFQAELSICSLILPQEITRILLLHSSTKHLEELVCSYDNEPEHKMRHDLGRSLHPYITPSMVIFQIRIHPLHAAPNHAIKPTTFAAESKLSSASLAAYCPPRYYTDRNSFEVSILERVGASDGVWVNVNAGRLNKDYTYKGKSYAETTTVSGHKVSISHQLNEGDIYVPLNVKDKKVLFQLIYTGLSYKQAFEIAKKFSWTGIESEFNK